MSDKKPDGASRQNDTLEIRKDSRSLGKGKKIKEEEKETSEIEEMLEGGGVPREIRRLIMGSMQTRSSGIQRHPILEKVTAEHIDKIIEYNYQEGKNAFKLSSSNRWFHALYVFIGVGCVIFLITYISPSNKDLINDILKILAGLIGGFGFGYGLGSRKRERD